MENFQIHVELPIALSAEHAAGIEEAVHHCLVHNTLLHPPKIMLEVSGLVRQANKQNGSPTLEKVGVLHSR